VELHKAILKLLIGTAKQQSSRAAEQGYEKAKAALERF
jgi:hypothetical protein